MDSMDLDASVPEATTSQSARLTGDDAHVRMPTYGDLLEFHKTYLPAGHGEQQFKNSRSGLNKFLEHIGKDMKSLVGQELGEQFPETLKALSEVLLKAGGNKRTIRNLESHLRRWASILSNLVADRHAPKNRVPHEVLKYYLALERERNPKLNQRALLLRCGFSKTFIHENLVSKTINRTFFNSSVAPKLAKLEPLIGAPPTSLTSLCTNQQLFGMHGSISKKEKSRRGLTEAGKKQRAINTLPEYYLKTFTLQLATEIKAFVKFKTAPSVYPLDRNMVWRLQPNSKFSGDVTHLEYASPDGNHYSETALIFVSSMQSFFGCLASKGYDPKKFSIAYLTDISLLSEYLDFFYERHGRLTESPMKVFTYSGSLLLKGQGWLRQQPSYSNMLPSQISEAEWDSYCEKQRTGIVRIMKDHKKSNSIKTGRSPKDDLKTILDLDHPIKAIFDVTKNMQDCFEKYGHSWFTPKKIAMERDIFLFRMLPVQPLRIKMYRTMTYREDNTGNLYKMRDGRWAVRFKKEDFKNETGAAKNKNYDVPLPVKLTSHIENYLFNVRPQLSPTTDAVFLAANLGKKKVEGKTTLFLSNTIRRRSQQFIDIECGGFGAHGIRHIVASDYIKNNPNGYQIAADILHDRLDTVLKAYAHLKAADGYKFYHEYLDTIETEWRKAA